MAAPIEIRVTGAELVEKAYDTIRDGAANLTATQQAIANLIVPAVRGAAPVRSGALMLSIGASALPDNRVRLTVGVVYGGVIEWGWRARGISGQHYAARGIMAQKQAIAGLYAEGLTRVCATAQAGG